MVETADNTSRQEESRPQDEVLFEHFPGAYGQDVIKPWQELETVDPRARLLANLAIENSGVGERDRFITRFDWIPTSRAEVNIALKSLGLELKITGRTPKNSLVASENAYNHARKFQAESNQSFFNLQEALVLEDDHRPSISRIRSDFGVKKAMAEFLLGRESLDAFKWLPGKTSQSRKISQKDKRKFLLMRDLEKSTDEELEEVWRDAYASSLNRASFWYEQLEAVKDNQRVQEIQSEARHRRV